MEGLLRCLEMRDVPGEFGWVGIGGRGRVWTG